MRNIPVKEWKIINKEGQEATEDTLVVLSILVSMKKPEELPRGFEQFKLFKKLTKAFDKAKETKVLSLEENEYKFLKETIVKDIPMQWGANPYIYEAVDAFMNCKEE